MLGKYVHSIIGSDAHAAAMIEILESYQKAGYKYILSSHANVEEQDAVTEKIACVKKLRGLAAQCKTGEEFICAAEKAFPDYAGKNYLEMTQEICSKNKIPKTKNRAD